MTRILQLVHEICTKGIHVTKRDLFYTDVKLFEVRPAVRALCSADADPLWPQDQKKSDAVLDDVSCMLGCTRSSLNGAPLAVWPVCAGTLTRPTSRHLVVASEKGIVVGRLTFREDGDLIDCSKVRRDCEVLGVLVGVVVTSLSVQMGIGGKAIPPNIDKVDSMTSDAQFILLVEKDAAFMRLAEDRFYNRFPCVIITAKGQPDVATRCVCILALRARSDASPARQSLFLKKMKTDLRIPVLGLVDSDPYGLKILSVYMSGSKNMSYDSSNLTTPDIKWLGVRPSDLDRCGAKLLAPSLKASY